jgi:hypothetical protein
MLPVALVCPFLIAPLVSSLCYQLLWLVHTNQSNWKHREKTKGAIKNGQTRATGNIEKKPKGQTKWTSQNNWQHSEKTKEAIKKDKPEQLAT